MSRFGVTYQVGWAGDVNVLVGEAFDARETGRTGRYVLVTREALSPVEARALAALLGVAADALEAEAKEGSKGRS